MILRRLKIAYMIFNFFHKKRLKHNVPLYKKINLKKHYFSSISSKDFEGINPNILKNPLNINIQDTQIYKTTDEENKKSLLNYNDEGFAVLRQFIDINTVNKINEEIDHLLKTKELKFIYRTKLMFAFKKSETIKNIGLDKYLIELLSTLMNQKVELFQSINFIMGSEQSTHSDSIHMTTFPLGGLLGVWIALEDIDIDNGALHYYPKSHLLPYYLNKDYDNEGNKFLIGDKLYTEYEKMIQQKISELPLEKKILKAKAGDLLIWHANLFHGGEPHINKNKTRKSMVFHYFAENSICYHEISQRPALIN